MPFVVPPRYREQADLVKGKAQCDYALLAFSLVFTAWIKKILILGLHSSEAILMGPLIAFSARITNATDRRSIVTRCICTPRVNNWLLTNDQWKTLHWHVLLLFLGSKGGQVAPMLCYNHLPSVHMRSEGYGIYFVCKCVSLSVTVFNKPAIEWH